MTARNVHLQILIYILLSFIYSVFFLHHAYSQEIPKKGEKGNTILTLNDCINLALKSNQEIIQKQLVLNQLKGEELIDKSRFFNHLDIFGEYQKKQGILTHTYFPNLSPQPAMSGMDSIDLSKYNLGEEISNLGGLSDIQKLIPEGLDLSSIFSGIDINQLMGLKQKKAQPNDDEPFDLIEYLEALQKQYEDLIEQLRKIIENIQQQNDTYTQQWQQYMKNIQDQINAYSEQLKQLSKFSEGLIPSDKPEDTYQLSIRYSRRLLEFGKDSSSAVAIRSKKRKAVFEYQEKVREILCEVRKTFFSILLKQEQIETRKKLLDEYEDKFKKLEERFKTAQDILKIDVLTAELDVLNEKLIINSLEKQQLKDKMVLLQLIGLPLDNKVIFEGKIEPFNYNLEEIINLTVQNSYPIAMLKEEIKEQERVVKEIAWEYRPNFQGKMGVENNQGSVSLSLNRLANVWGLDLGTQKFLYLKEQNNIWKGLSNPNNKENYFINLSVLFPLLDGKEKKGAKLKESTKLQQLKAQLKNKTEREMLEVRKAYQVLQEALERIKMQEERVNISKRRLEITRVLREHGKVMDIQLEKYREIFFRDQDVYFNEQENVIKAQENLRKIMGVFN